MNNSGLANASMNDAPHLISTTRQALAIAAALLVLTTALFVRACGNQFVEIDDREYVVQNPYVAGGLTAQGLAWLRHGIVVGNWHPLTMLSHMLDAQLYGLRPAGHHLTSVLLHSVNVALVFWVFWRMTGQLVAPALLALLFGWHPQRVESVAWVAERKDVLSGCLGLLTVWAYSCWTERRGAARYALVAILFAAGLLTKPMLVTLPCVLLLLDYWPLRRVEPPAAGQRANWRCWQLLVLEKLPLFALTGLFSAITYGTQAMVVEQSSRSLPARICESLLAYLDYINQMVWPAKLAVYYPAEAPQLGAALVAGALLLAVTVAAWSWRRERPYLPVGWFWYLGVLVPVIGIVKAGGQARADRYTYLPSIGIALAVAWFASEWAAADRRRGKPLLAVAALVAATLAAVTWRQIGAWRDSETLFRHAAAVTKDNALAINGLGHALMEKGQLDAAMAELDRALAIAPRFGIALCSKAYLQHHFGQFEASDATYRQMLAVGQQGATERTNYGFLLLDLERYQEALGEFTQARELNPGSLDAARGQGLAEAALGRHATAAALLQTTLRADPSSVAALAALARLYAAPQGGPLKNPAEALRLADEAVRLSSEQDPWALEAHAVALKAAGKRPEAERRARQALEVIERMEVKSPRILQLERELRGMAS